MELTLLNIVFHLSQPKGIVNFPIHQLPKVKITSQYILIFDLICLSSIGYHLENINNNCGCFILYFETFFFLSAGFQLHLGGWMIINYHLISHQILRWRELSLLAFHLLSNQKLSVKTLRFQKIRNIRLIIVFESDAARYKGHLN